MEKDKLVTNDDLYKSWSIPLQAEKKEIEKELNDLYKSKDYIYSCLKKGEVYIKFGTNLNFENIDNIKLKSEISNIKYKFVSTNFCLYMNRTNLADYLYSYLEIKRKIKKLEYRLSKFETIKVDIKVYKFIIRQFNLKLVDLILKGFTFYLGYGLGFIKIRKKERKKAGINWKESNIERQKVIDEGNIPFEVTERNEKGEAIKDNGGKKWFIYHITDYVYHWVWKFVQVNTTHPYKYYTFIPTTFTKNKRGNIQLLAALSEEYKERTFTKD